MAHRHHASASISLYQLNNGIIIAINILRSMASAKIIIGNLNNQTWRNICRRVGNKRSEYTHHRHHHHAAGYHHIVSANSGIAGISIWRGVHQAWRSKAAS